MTKAVRGAVQIENDTPDEIKSGVSELIKAIFRKNDVKEKNIVSIHFSQTADLRSMNPAAALRVNGFSETPLFCSQEPDYEGSQPKIIRVLITFSSPGRKKPVPVYIHGAESLRPDLADKK